MNAGILRRFVVSCSLGSTKGLGSTTGSTPFTAQFPPSMMHRLDKRFATKKMGASKARQKKRPEGKRLGMKRYPGEFVREGYILMKQRGTPYHPGQNVAMGRDHTLYATMSGYVRISEDAKQNRQYVHVLSEPPTTVNNVNGKALYREPHQPLHWSKVAGGWRNADIYTRDPVHGKRIFKLVDLTKLPQADTSDLSAVEFNPMIAHLRAMQLDSVLLQQQPSENDQNNQNASSNEKQQSESVDKRENASEQDPSVSMYQFPDRFRRVLAYQHCDVKPMQPGNHHPQS